MKEQDEFLQLIREIRDELRQIRELFQGEIQPLSGGGKPPPPPPEDEQ